MAGALMPRRTRREKMAYTVKNTDADILRNAEDLVAYIDVDAFADELEAMAFIEARETELEAQMKALREERARVRARIVARAKINFPEDAFAKAVKQLNRDLRR
jgi:anti-sigma factor RsiW